MDATFSFADQTGTDMNHVESPAVLGPKNYLGLTSDPMTTKYLDEIVAQRGYLYLWGWAKYNDVFEKTPEHITRFCYSLTPIAVNRDERAKLVTLRYRFNNCPQYTCADEDCTQ
jgi:hypothetical protein